MNTQGYTLVAQKAPQMTDLRYYVVTALLSDGRAHYKSFTIDRRDELFRKEDEGYYADLFDRAMEVSYCVVADLRRLGIKP